MQCIMGMWQKPTTAQNVKHEASSSSSAGTERKFRVDVKMNGDQKVLEENLFEAGIHHSILMC